MVNVLYFAFILLMTFTYLLLMPVLLVASFIYWLYLEVVIEFVNALAEGRRL